MRYQDVGEGCHGFYVLLPTAVQTHLGPHSSSVASPFTGFPELRPVWISQQQQQRKLRSWVFWTRASSIFSDNREGTFRMRELDR